MNEILIIEIVLGLLILVVLYRQRGKQIVMKSSNEDLVDKLNKEYVTKQSSLLEIEKQIRVNVQEIKTQTQALEDLDKKYETARKKFRNFNLQDGYAEFEKLEVQRAELDKYVKDVQVALEKYRGYFEPHKCAAIITMLRDKLKRCCHLDTGDDIDEILKEHVMDITSEVKKDEHEQKRKRGSDYER